MDDFLKNIIYLQNKELLNRIANDNFNDKLERNDFIKKYHKKNFSHLIEVKRDNSKKESIKINRLMCVK
tara:strand:+ start:604 stop:810 length:207 start_codon:yes stop_codon:yes gene_type:complete